MNLFIAGTDTGVGKTFAAVRILRALRRAGLKAAGFKPICCGDREDAERLREAGEPGLGIDEINPVWLRAPLAPYVASMVEERPIDLARIRERFAALRRTHDALLVEGAGGWRVPITRDFDFADLAKEFGFPVALVVPNRLGAINHTLLTLESIRARGVECAGLILNTIAADGSAAQQTNRAVLEELSGVPLILELEPGQTDLEFALV